MGLLSSLGFLQQGLFQPQQQQPFSPYFGAEQQPPIAQPQPRRAMTQPGIPALPEQISPMQSSAAAPLSAPNAPGASPNVNFMDRLSMGAGRLNENPLFTLGMSLMGNARGSNWGGVGEDMRAFGQQRQQQQQLENERRRQGVQDQREASIFGRQQTEWGQQDQQRRDWEQALRGEADPQRQAQLRAMGPQGYGDYLARERQMEFQAREGQLDRDAQQRAAANENSLGRMFQSMDAQQLGAMNQRASVLQAQTLPALRQVRDNILRAGQAATGQPIDYNSRIVLNRVFNGQGSDRQALETWRARILRPALEMLPPGPATNRDVELVMENFANPNMQLGSALSLIDERIAAAERETIQTQAANDFFGQANGLTGTRNQTGQDWPTFLSERLASAPGTSPLNDGGAPTAGAGSGPPPPPIGTVRDGHRYVGGDPANPASWQRINTPSQNTRRFNNGNIR